jgi:isoleucyl-tRNA synthetase
MSKPVKEKTPLEDETRDDETSFNFPKEEENVLKMWTEKDAFNTQLKLSENRKRYTFYDGPPFATGWPDYTLIFFLI